MEYNKELLRNDEFTKCPEEEGLAIGGDAGNANKFVARCLI